MSEQFGKYELVRRLAFGGMAEIFLGALKLEQGFEKRVVLKRILPNFSSDPVFVQMFVDEAVLAARLDHPNIVQVYDFGNVDGTYYIAMEWIDGIDLRRALRESQALGRALSFTEVAAMGEGAARGLAYAHNFCNDSGQCFNIVHRDVSPHNIMLSKVGEPKVMDFGIAKAEARASRTATGTIKGKLAYMAPEHASGKPLDKRADQFSLGIVLWECLTGERLFRGDSDLEVMRQVMECNVRPVRELRADVPEALESVIMRMLSTDAAARYNDLCDVEQALSAFRFSLGAAGAVQLSSLVQAYSAPNIVGSASRGQRHTLVLPTADAEPDDHTQATLADSSPDHVAPTASVTPLCTEAPDNAEVNASVELAPMHAGGSQWWVGLAALIGVLGVALGGVVLWQRVGSKGAEALVDVSVLRVAVPLKSHPAGAAIFVDGAELGLVTPALLPGFEVGSTVTIELRLPGHQPWRRQHIVALHDEGVRATLQAKPEPLPAEATHAAAVEAEHAQKAAPPAAPVIRDRPSGTSRGAGRLSKVSAAALPAPGSLSLRTAGAWADVYLGKEHLGTTPLNRVQIPAGEHQLILRNAAAGIEQKINVRIPPGQEVRRSVSLR